MSDPFPSHRSSTCTYLTQLSRSFNLLTRGSDWLILFDVETSSHWYFRMRRLRFFTNLYTYRLVRISIKAGIGRPKPETPHPHGVRPPQRVGLVSPSTSSNISRPKPSRSPTSSKGRAHSQPSYIYNNILVTTLSSRGRALTSSENRTNHSCFYNVA